MKGLCTALMLILSTLCMSQITMTTYDSNNDYLNETRKNMETSYISNDDESILTVISSHNDTTTTLHYKILEVGIDALNMTWINYKCVDTNGHNIDYTFFYNGENIVTIQYQNGNYSVLDGAGLLY